MSQNHPLENFFNSVYCLRWHTAFICHIPFVSFGSLPQTFCFFMPLAFLINTGWLFNWIFNWLRFGFLRCFLMINLILPIFGQIATWVMCLSHSFTFRGPGCNFAFYWWYECSPLIKISFHFSTAHYFPFCNYWVIYGEIFWDYVNILFLIKYLSPRFRLLIILAWINFTRMVEKW